MKGQYAQTARVGLIKACLRLIDDPNRVWWQRLLLALTPLLIVYVLSPLDIIPEVFLGPLGLADDSIIVVTLFLLARLAVSFYSEKKYTRPTKNAQGKDIIDL
jgi:uncharacterized membrane protein YkvA (DUF1232 family)